MQISLAQWALVDEMRQGLWKNLDFPRIARKDFGLDGIEFVNTLFEVPTEDYLQQLKGRAEDYGVGMVLIMVDDEGDGCASTSAGRRQFEINHRKWVDIAHYLGCQGIRTNCRGPQGVNKSEALRWAEETYHLLLDYARPGGIQISIENHGGVSDDADWLVQLVKTINDPLFGTYPDWREPRFPYDHVDYLRKTVHFAKGMSYRNQPEDSMTLEMLHIAQDSGYSGWYGIESSGREAIRKGIKFLQAHA